MEILKHILIRFGGVSLVVYSFLMVSEKMVPETFGNYPSMGFMLAFLGIGSVLLLIIFSLLLADVIYLHKKKKLILRNISLFLVGLFILFIWYYIPKI